MGGVGSRAICAARPVASGSSDDSPPEHDDAGENELPDWLQLGLINAFDDPLDPSPAEESEEAAGPLRPPAGWRHSLPNDGIFTPVQWTRPLPCAWLDWVEPRSALCCCLEPPLEAALRACAPAGLRGPVTLDVASSDHWDEGLLARLREPSLCPAELDGWWWVDGDIARSGELFTFHDAHWRSAHECDKWTDAGIVRPRNARGLGATAGALLSGAREGYVFDTRYRRAYVAPGHRWLFRVAPDEFRVVEYKSRTGASNALVGMYRLRRVLRAPGAALGERAASRRAGAHPPARAEFVARARAPRPHEPIAPWAACCACAGAPTCVGIGAAERLDNALVAVNPRAQFMWRGPGVHPGLGSAQPSPKADRPKEAGGDTGLRSATAERNANGRRGLELL
ncbi:hypothetical protein KFE25_005607 [Diacronema lutheri]|uniref:Uncharacterized protein n=1 Tax=Diacronema lutheri TaxID=2081491 RepID=A0A8J5XPU2_DIALT|nr:hypothetical protein KFE25_005607 [Diacronema lutheri]